jgi:hypothetical protein
MAGKVGIATDAASTAATDRPLNVNGKFTVDLPLDDLIFSMRWRGRQLGADAAFASLGERWSSSQVMRLSVYPIVEIGQQTCYAKFAYYSALPNISSIVHGVSNGYELAD